MLLSPVWLIAFGLPDWRLCLLLMLPMLADGFAQRLTPYQSGNLRRLVTGMLFGFALIGLLAVSTVYVAHRSSGRRPRCRRSVVHNVCST